ncbi:MAG: hypothetical protein ACP5NK_07165 [Thermoplasmata archaeon]
MTTQFEFRESKKLVIHNYTQYETIYQLIESEFVGLEGVKDEDENEIQGVLRWTKGVVMLASPVPVQNDTIIKEMMDGNVHWGYLAFAPMKDYQRIITTEFGRFLVLDSSKSKLMKDLASIIANKFLSK